MEYIGFLESAKKFRALTLHPAVRHKDLAKVLSISPSTLSNMCSGRVPITIPVTIKMVSMGCPQDLALDMLLLQTKLKFLYEVGRYDRHGSSPVKDL